MVTITPLATAPMLVKALDSRWPVDPPIGDRPLTSGAGLVSTEFGRSSGATGDDPVLSGATAGFPTHAANNPTSALPRGAPV